MQQFRLSVAALIIALLLLALIPAQAMAKPESKRDIKADKVLVLKSERKMYLLHKKNRIREYAISLGDAPEGHKQQQGDEKTPEGNYVIDYRNPKSKYHLSLHISYPSAADRKSAKQRGVNPGGDIFIHGLPNGMGFLSGLFTGDDWTDGCIAVTNREIEEIWRMVPNGTPIEIRP